MRYRPLSSFDPHKYQAIITLVDTRGGSAIIPSKEPKRVRERLYHYRYALRRTKKVSGLSDFYDKQLDALNRWKFRIVEGGLEIYRRN